MQQTSASSAPAWLSGGCHCGRVRFRVRKRSSTALECNCSVCRKKGLLHLIVHPSDFELSQGAEALTVYTFNSMKARHTFCRVCGVQAFYTPRSHPDHVDVNVRCLDGDAAASFGVEAFDGRNWERNVGALHERVGTP